MSELIEQPIGQFIPTSITIKIEFPAWLKLTVLALVAIAVVKLRSSK